jgi:integrase
VGDHPLVKGAMSGVDIKRPPQPKYCVIWDVENVLDFLRKLPKDEELSLKMLTHKTAMLLALATVSRGSELKMMDIKFMAESETKLVFHYSQPPKHFRKKGVSPKPLEIMTSGMSLCPVNTTKNYILRTAILRGENTGLFIATVKPYRPVTRATIGRWLKEILKSSGVNVETFKGHSTRSASSTGAFAKGASIKDIMERGNWSNASTWQRFYRSERA